MSEIMATIAIALAPILSIAFVAYYLFWYERKSDNNQD
ncbi:hypothetical protein DEU29_11715 [Idiomarina aquatica]|jgi:nitrate reductase NapE component|uniref:Uncharacterized protein n=1 Tax=Idiomarina aquatica TaxID=1327752 RepID=A0A4R6P0B9_9GAMM|nr:hypothetical protein DEU29_11715 [Idiomarina aquatica]